MRTVLVALLLAGSGPVFTVQDPRIDEASGMVDLGAVGTVVANDSGDIGRVFLLDARGRTVGTTTYGAAVDVEALAPAGPSSVWVGDIGDNQARRPSVEVRRVPVGRGERRVDAPAYRLVYPDGPHDAETLLRDPRTGRLYVVTKTLGGGTAYAAPARLSPSAPNRLRRVARVPVVLATDGAFLDAHRVVVRGYGAAQVFSFPGFDEIGSSVVLPRQEQGESLSVGPGGRVRIGSEGVRQPVLEIDLPSPARADDTPARRRHDGGMPSFPAQPGVAEASSDRRWPLTGGVAAVVVLTLLGSLALRRRR